MNLDKIAKKYGIDLRREYTVSVDFENNAEDWWSNGGRDLWCAFVSPTIWVREQKVVGREVAVFLAAAEKIPGWVAGPDYAKTPFCVSEA